MKGGEQYGSRAGSSRKGLGAFPSTSLIWISLGEAYLLDERRPEGRADATAGNGKFGENENASGCL